MNQKIMHPVFLAVIFAWAGFLAPQAAAQDYKTLLDIPEGTTLVHLSVTERAEVDQDLLVATLRYQAENVSPKQLQHEINTTMREALDAAKKVNGLKVSTQNYSIYEYDPNRYKDNIPAQKIWRGSQSLLIKGKNADDLLELAGTLQEMGLSMNGLNYRVSPELREETQNNMLEAALGKLLSKAQRTAQALGKKEAQLLQVHVDVRPGHYREPVAYSAMARSDAERLAAPVAAPGQSEIMLSVSAQALITP